LEVATVADDGPRGRRDFNQDRPQRGGFGRPRRDFGSDRPRRDFGPDRPRRDFDRDRPAGGFDRPRREFDRPRRDSDRPRRDFDRPPGERPDSPSGGSFDRPRRQFDRPPQRGFDRPPQRRFDRPPDRSFDRRAPGVPPVRPSAVNRSDYIEEGDELVAGRRPVSEAFAARRPAKRLLVVPERRAALETRWFCTPPPSAFRSSRSRAGRSHR
jgi:hypothetical protein